MSNIKSIKNIELSSVCNMSCEYCLSPHIKNHRKTGFMTFETFRKVVDKIVKFDNEGTQGQVWLHGTGESLLHPDFIEMSGYIRERFKGAIMVSTNGKLVDDKMAKGMGAFNSVHVSGHDDMIAQQASLTLQNNNMTGIISTGPRDAKLNWAGQLDFPSVNRHPLCPWLSNAECMVLHDGSVVTCCFDAYGVNVLGNIADVENLESKLFNLCKSCNHEIGESQ